MKVLVTGGAGYIGNYVTEQALEHGHEVRVLDSFLFGDDALAPFEDHDRLEVREGDIRHIEDLSYAMEGMDAVVHMAGIVGDPACGVNEQATQAVNVEATKSESPLAVRRVEDRFRGYHPPRHPRRPG